MFNLRSRSCSNISTTLPKFYVKQLTAVRSEMTQMHLSVNNDCGQDSYSILNIYSHTEAGLGGHDAYSTLISNCLSQKFLKIQTV